MPLIGNQEQLNYTNDMWSNLTTCIDRDIALFQLEAIKPTNFSFKLFGLWNVRCGNTVLEVGRIQPWTRWYTGADAYVEFWPDKAGICSTFVPDDERWHNRIKMANLINSSIFRVKALHQNSGPTIPEQPIMRMFQTLYTHMHVWAAFTVIPITLGNRRQNKVTYLVESKKKADCEAEAAKFLENHPEAEVKVDIVPTAPVRELIARHGQREWMLHEEFQRGLLVDLKKECDAALGPLQDEKVEAVNNLKSALAVLTNEELLNILSAKLGSGAAQPAPVVAGEEDGPAPSDRAPVEIKDIQNIATLRSIAKQLGVKFAFGTKRAELKALIIKKQTEMKEDAGATSEEPDTNDLATAPVEELT